MLRSFLVLIVFLGAAVSVSAQERADETFQATTILTRLQYLSTKDRVSAACCKHCRKGKACGDSCISKSKSCHVGKGCACNG